MTWVVQLKEREVVVVVKCFQVFGLLLASVRFCMVSRVFNMNMLIL